MKESESDEDERRYVGTSLQAGRKPRRYTAAKTPMTNVHLHSLWQVRDVVRVSHAPASGACDCPV